MLNILVSACLLGVNCKYNGNNNYNEDVLKLKKYFNIIPVCPEVFGGLPTPRTPSEICGDRVVSKDGVDVTTAFTDGAEKTLYIAREKNCPAALLKERSPSCGCGKIYDGSFTSNLVDGNGITAELLINNDICVFGEGQINKLLQLYSDVY